MEIIVGILLVVALVYAWYTEQRRRKTAELEADLLVRRRELDGLQDYLDAQKQIYESALADLNAESIPAHMLDNVGKRTVLTHPQREQPATDPRGTDARLIGFGGEDQARTTDEVRSGVPEVQLGVSRESEPPRAVRKKE